jgi:hypothetical protein
MKAYLVGWVKPSEAGVYELRGIGVTSEPAWELTQHSESVFVQMGPEFSAEGYAAAKQLVIAYAEATYPQFSALFDWV